MIVVKGRRRRLLEGAGAHLSEAIKETKLARSRQSRPGIAATRVEIALTNIKAVALYNHRTCRIHSRDREQSDLERLGGRHAAASRRVQSTIVAGKCGLRTLSNMILHGSIPVVTTAYVANIVAKVTTYRYLKMQRFDTYLVSKLNVLAL